jgi:hypothetical protein
MTNVRIFLFYLFSDVAVNLNLVEAKNLDRNIIIELLNTPTIMKDLNIINKK